MQSRVLVGLLATIVGCSSDPPEIAGLPTEVTPGSVMIEWAGPNLSALLVPVYINNQGPYSFVLDTGATITCVDTRLARELELPRRGGNVGAVGLGGAGRIELVRIDSLRVGEAAANDVSACAVDLSLAEQVGVEFDGLLGLNFLRAYDLLIDFAGGQVTLTVP